MKNLLNFIFLSSVLLLPQSHAITFQSTTLNDVSEPNYIKLIYPSNGLGVNFETISADFNGDGFEDILSLGGQTSNFGTGGITVTIPLTMMLYDDGEYKDHDIGVNFTSAVVNVVDVDKDGDLDVVTLSGYILINDGVANFSVERYNNQWSAGNNVFTFDWDNDGDLDIVTQKRIFLNDGALNFTQDFATLNFLQQGMVGVFNYSDINQDGRIDLVVGNGTQLQSWIKNEQGDLVLTNEINLGNPIIKIQAMPPKDGSQNFLVVSSDVQSTQKLYHLLNDGTGVFLFAEINVELQDIGSGGIEYTKFFNVDLNNDGSDELVVSANYLDFLDCDNSQSLVLILERGLNNDWQIKEKLHSEAYRDNGLLSEFSIGRKDIPLIIDLNADNLPDIIQQGDKTMVWLNQSSSIDWFSFKLSNKSISQFNKGIDVVDYDHDGKVDIFMAAQYEPRCTSPDLFYTPENFIISKLWMGQGGNAFAPFSSPFGGGNDFLRNYEYAIFADLEGNDEQNLIVTTPANNSIPRASRYVYPRTHPVLAFDLPEVTLNAQTAQMNASSSSRQIVMIADTIEAPIIVSQLGSGGIVEVARLNFGARNGEFKIADMDGDGDLDIVANTKSQSDSITIWYNDGLMNFSRSDSFGVAVRAIAIMDVNDDNKLDIVTANETHDIWLNQAHGEFDKLDYDASFWHRPVGAADDFQNIIASKLQVVDINNDGLLDIVAGVNSTYNVYLNESTSIKPWFYSVYSIATGVNRRLTNVFFKDMNHDDKMDFISTDNNAVIISTQGKENLITGLFYNPSNNGHGYSVDEIGYGNLYYSIFYSYDDNGSPEWYATLNRYNKHYAGEVDFEFISLYSENVQTPIRYKYDYANRKSMVDDRLEYKGWINFQQQAHADRLNRVHFKVGEGSDSWHLESILSEDKRPESDLSGHWWAGENDSGWGISLNFQETEGVQLVVATLYFYDEEGQPVWVIGTQEGFELNQDITINMEKVNGYGRLQNFLELTRVPAGTITINLNQASQDLNQAGLLSMNIHYPDDSSNDNWVREAIPFGLLSKPRMP